MRMLIKTGWLNFRMRAMLVSFATYQLWLHWKPVADHLAGMFVDYEPGIHYSQIQMQSGTTGMNIPRIYNPIKQAIEKDPEGKFIRKWVPELSALPDELIFTPWKLFLNEQVDFGVLIGKHYPYPICCPDTALAEAKRKYTIWRRGINKDTTHKLILKHASRKQRRTKRTAETLQKDLFDRS